MFIISKAPIACRFYDMLEYIVISLRYYFRNARLIAISTIIAYNISAINTTINYNITWDCSNNTAITKGYISRHGTTSKRKERFKHLL